MNTRRLLVPVASAAAVVAIAVGATVLTDGDSSRDADGARAALGSPTLPALVIGGGGAGDAAATALSAAEGTRKIGPPVGGGGTPSVTLKGELPTATDTPVPAYRLARRTVSRDEVAKLAAALGLTGDPQQQGAGWVVSDTSRSLFVEASPMLDWRLMAGEVCVSIIPGSSAGGSGSPDQPVAEPADGAAVTKGAPAPADDPAAGGPALTPVPVGCAGGVVSSGSVSSGVACAPPDAQTLVACPTPEAKPAASEATARAAALELLRKVGLTLDEGDLRVDEGFDGVRRVWLSRRVGGLRVEGTVSEVAVGPDGKVVSAYGQLVEPVAVGAYPMLPPQELAQQLANSRMVAMICEQKPGVEGCAPPPPIVVTGASVGLSVVYPMDYEKGEAYLLPSWLFTIEGDPQPSAVVAVPKQFLTQAEIPTPNDGTIEPMPLPATGGGVDPAPATDTPATVDPAATTGPAAEPTTGSEPAPSN